MKTEPCNICHKLGHWSRDCPENPKNKVLTRQTIEALEKKHPFLTMQQPPPPPPPQESPEPGDGNQDAATEGTTGQLPAVDYTDLGTVASRVARCEASPRRVPLKLGTGPLATAVPALPPSSDN